MGKNKQYLTFTISNSPLLYSETEFRLKWCHRPIDYDISPNQHGFFLLDDLQIELKKCKRFKLGGALPKESQIYIVEYAGPDDFNIFITKDAYIAASDTDSLLLVPTLIFNEPNTHPKNEVRAIARGIAIDDSLKWDLFYDLAWPEDICVPVSFVSMGLTEDILMDIDIRESFDSLKNYSDATILNIIGSNPQILRRHPIFTEFLINYLETAKEKQGAERQVAKKLLADCLVPKKNSADNRYKKELAIDLMLKLTNEIKKRCKHTLNAEIHGSIEIDKKAGNMHMLSDPDYDTLKDKSNDARISVLSKRQLSLLLFSPATKYIHELLDKVTA